MSSNPEHHNLTDEQLVDRYRQGDPIAFAELVSRYEHELFHFLVRFLNSRATAEDVFQDTFLQVHTSIDTFHSDKRFKPWLFTIATNKARDVLRRQARRSTSLLSEPVTSGGDSDEGLAVVDLMQAPLPDPGELVGDEEIRLLVRQVISELPEHLREILLLAYFHQFPYKEIADMLSIPLGTVKSRLHAAVGAFAQQWSLREPGGEPGGM